MEDDGKVQDINPGDFRETPEYQAADGAAQPAQGPMPENTQEEPQGQPRKDILNELQSRGYDVSGYESDEDLVTDTEAKYAANIQEDEQRIRDNAKLQREFLESSHQAAPALPGSPGRKPAGGDKPGSSDVPEFDPAWSDLVEDDGNGRYVVRPEYIGSVSPEIAERVNDYVAFRQQRSNSLIDDPVNTVMDAGLGQKIQQQINATVQQALSTTNIRNQASDFVRENEKILYLHDEKSGQPQLDRKGKPILSPVGQALNQAHATLRQQGMHDPVSRHQVAMQMVQNYFTQQQLSLQNQSAGGQQQMAAGGQHQPPQNQDYKEQYVDQPFAEPTNPHPPGYMPNTPVQPGANSLGPGGLPEHNSLGSLATALAVHKGYLQPK